MLGIAGPSLNANAIRHYNVGEDIMFSVVSPPRSFVRSSGQIFLPRYLMNALRNLDETYREYSLAPIDDLVGF